MREREFIQSTLDDMAIFVRSKYAMRDGMRISTKREANDLLTEVDLAVQEEIVGRIQEEFPHDAIYGEEAGMNEVPADPDGRTWLIDPIDGTQNFVRGLFPAFGISLGFAEQGRPVVGGVAVPGRGELYLAEKGGGAFRNGERIVVSDVGGLASARAEVDFSGPWDREEILHRFSRLMVEIGQVRCHCAAVIGLCSIATADMDAYVHVALNPFDYAAAMIIVEEAGGRVTRLNGGPIHLFDGGRGVLASNGLLHDSLRSIIV
ncbi:MAG: inositol monophosphatase [Candidatus Hydrogenedentes bacterium]|nr:inositol monophosphatase [Candidatus Hydrogenedentota bacterium]